MNAGTPTLHNAAKFGEIGPTVLMPGDPLRAKFIADQFLTGAKLVSDVRNIYAYTGKYKGTEVSVMASGMGASSMGIYSHELFEFYGVENIIRVGSAGGLHPSLKLRDIVIGLASSTDTGYAAQFNLPGTFAPSADFGLVEQAVTYARANNLPAVVGRLFSGEAFYYDNAVLERWTRMGVLAVEMESAALYLNAAHSGKKAVALCTISDMVFTGEACTTAERQESFTDMITMALEMAHDQS